VAAKQERGGYHSFVRGLYADARIILLAASICGSGGARNRLV